MANVCFDQFGRKWNYSSVFERVSAQQQNKVCKPSKHRVCMDGIYAKQMKKSRPKIENKEMKIEMYVYLFVASVIVFPPLLARLRPHNCSSFARIHDFRCYFAVR